MAAENCVRLVFQQGSQLHTVILEKGRYEIGRAETCDVRLPPESEGVSRRHAAVENRDGTWYIIDLKSRNGTFVNKIKATDQPLRDGDKIILGEQIVTFYAPAPDHADVTTDDSVVNVTSRINIEQLNQTLGGAGRPRGTTVASEKPSFLSGVHQGVVDVSGPDQAQTGSWVIGLFKQAGESLLHSSSLDEFLDQVVKLVFANLPGDRASICLCDERGQSIIPKIARHRDGRSESIAVSRTIVNQVLTQKNSVLVSDAQNQFDGAVSIMQMKIMSAMCAPLYAEGRVIGFVYVDSQEGLQPFNDQDLQLLTALSLLSAVGIEQTRLRENIVKEQKIRERLSRYSSPAVVEQIVSQSEASSSEMVAIEREATVVFSDLSGFTAMSEHMNPPDIARVLNEVFEGLTDSIFHFEGTLDKYMGDGMMAIFGAPLFQADHAVRAVQAALMMFERLEQFNRKYEGLKKITMRVGINSGRVVAGDIGSPRRRDYTVIGDTVNVASRLESGVAKPGQIVIGPATFELAKHKVNVQELAEFALKGRAEKVKPYLVLGMKAKSGEFLRTQESQFGI